MPLPVQDARRLTPLTETGSGPIREKEKARLAEIITHVNDLFEGDRTDNDQLAYVNNAIKGKLLECETLVQQAANNKGRILKLARVGE